MKVELNFHELMFGGRQRLVGTSWDSAQLTNPRAAARARAAVRGWLRPEAARAMQSTGKQKPRTNDDRALTGLVFRNRKLITPAPAECE
jgi:hypothetical protein